MTKSAGNNEQRDQRHEDMKTMKQLHHELSRAGRKKHLARLNASDAESMRKG